MVALLALDETAKKQVAELMYDKDLVNGRTEFINYLRQSGWNVEINIVNEIF